MKGAASATAVLVCQGRAAADGRFAIGRFSDPVAATLLIGDERQTVELVRAESAPKGLGPRLEYEFVRGCAAVITPRTVAIDDAIRTDRVTQLVVLGAGLDARAWRMPELADATVFEVDHPASQADKRRRLGDRTPMARRVVFVESDFATDDLDRTLDGAGHRHDLPTTWVWEGVVPYLTADQVAVTLAAIENRSAPESRLVVNYQAPSGRAGFGQLVGRLMLRLAGKQDPWTAEPRRSHWTPERMAALLASRGFTASNDRSLSEIAGALHLRMDDARLARSLSTGRVVVAHRHRED